MRQEASRVARLGDLRRRTKKILFLCDRWNRDYSLERLRHDWIERSYRPSADSESDVHVGEQERSQALSCKLVSSRKRHDTRRNLESHGTLFDRRMRRRAADIDKIEVLGYTTRDSRQLGRSRWVLLQTRCINAASWNQLKLDLIYLGNTELSMEEVVKDQDGKTFFYQKRYTAENARFEDPLPEPQCPRAEISHRYCPACVRFGAVQQQYTPKVCRKFFLSHLVIVSIQTKVHWRTNIIQNIASVKIKSLRLKMFVMKIWQEMSKHILYTFYIQFFLNILFSTLYFNCTGSWTRWGKDQPRSGVWSGAVQRQRVSRGKCSLPQSRSHEI